MCRSPLRRPTEKQQHQLFVQTATLHNPSAVVWFMTLLYKKKSKVNVTYVYNNGEHDVFVPQQKVLGPFTVHSNGFLQWWQWFFSNFNSTVLEDAWVWLIERYARDILLKITVEWNELMSCTSKCMVKIMELPDKHFNFVLNILKHLSSKPSTSSPPTWLLMSTHFILRPRNYYFDHIQIFRRTCCQPLVVETQCNHKTKAAYMLLKWKEQVR